MALNSAQLSSFIGKRVIKSFGRNNISARCFQHHLNSYIIDPKSRCFASERLIQPPSFAANNIRFFSVQSNQEEVEEKIIPGINKGKTSTGLVGLAVEPDWFNIINWHFQALLDKMENSDMPETAQYRIDVTKWCNYVLRQVKENPNDPEAVEDACRSGQVEELIEQAKDEMEVLDMYLENRIWELVAQANPKIEFDPDPLADPFDPETGDPDVAEEIKEGVESMKNETDAWKPKPRRD